MNIKKTKKLRLFCFISQYSQYSGGPAKSMVLISQKISQNPNVELHVITFDVDKKEITKKIKFHLLPHSFLGWFLLPLTIIFLCLKFLFVPKVFYTSSSEIVSYLSPILAITRTKVLLVIHGFIFSEIDRLDTPKAKFLRKYKFLRKIHQIICKFGLSRANFVVAVSYKTREYLGKFIKKKIYVIYNPLPPEIENIKLRSVDQRKDILYVGGYKYHKGIDKVYKLASLLKKPQITVLGGGDTSIKKKYRRAIKISSLNNLLFLDHQKDIYPFMQSHLIFFQPSKIDNLPFAMIEAMGLGMIVISTPIGEVPRIIKNGKNGFLIHSNNKETAKKIEDLITQKEILVQISKEAKRTARQHFNLEKIANRFYKLITLDI